MKKITVVMGMVLAMVFLIAFTCYAENYYGCYQKSSGQLRVLTDKKDTCRQTELGPILLGGEVPEVPKICAGYVDGLNCNGTSCDYISSCISSVEYLETGKYKITFTKPFDQYPICVFYNYSPPRQEMYIEYTTGIPNEINVYIFLPADDEPFDNLFNFICTEP